VGSTPPRRQPRAVTDVERREERSMSWDEEDDTRIYEVVVNHEEQYSIWFADRELPLGWKKVGKSGTKQECLDYIEEVWTDMRPLSLRKKMEEMERQAAQESGGGEGG
jgi:MbtH protein